jgi:phospholipid/cholesterol/gamma-HCH transport system substrate-binding protein
MENRAHALAAGLFVLILGLATAAAVWWFRQDREALSYYLLETRQGVGGLNNEALVRYRGIRAGKVESIGIDAKDPRYIVVRISLDDDITLTQGTTARLALQGITGLTYIALDDQGDNQAPLTAPEGELPRITLAPTLFDVLSANAADTMRQFSTVVARLDKVLSDKNAGNLERLIDNAAVASDGLRELPAVMAGLRTALSPQNMKKLESTLTHLEQSSADAQPLVNDVRTLVGNLNRLSERMETLLGSGEAAYATLPRANALMKELTDTTRQFSRLLESLDDHPQSLIFGRPPVRPGPGEHGFASSPPENQPINQPASQE